MQIRGASNPTCKLCASCEINEDTYKCTLTGENKDKNDNCKKFKYDIYKYVPRKKMPFDKFKAEDFEI